MSANVIRIGNASGFYGDRLGAMREMLEGGELDVLTGDYLAELTMLILARDRMNDASLGYAKTFLRQMEDCLGLALDRGVTIVANAGGLNLFAGLNPERIMASAMAVGTGRYALTKATSYAKDRAVWRTPIGAHQGIAHPLARRHVELELARLMMQKAAVLYDGGDDVGAGEAANMAKYAAAEASIAALDTAVQTHGGNGLTREYGLASMLGAARVARVAPVSREMILNFVAQHSLGLPKSY
ncbi:acyl-CoA dehydrogenase family protein [Luteipulveratus halotolerans]|uniref:acyl-CoA dehydrogenase family protein n=1 Tax=Luteipulveratus halotolerans TaxID=1631356 RepID=UPI000B199C88|nr:acyl-CoA dehydrogenase family protein [Luteipulveratus halotolerans]